MKKVNNFNALFLSSFRMLRSNTFNPAIRVKNAPEGMFSILYIVKIVIIFIPIDLNMCFGCSKEASH